MWPRSSSSRRAATVVGGLVLVCLLGGVARAAAAEPVAASTTAPPERGHFVAGEELAKTVTLVTGVPISPLLGVSGLGAYLYLRTPPALRDALPWYARPWFWGIGLFLVFLFAANTTVGAAVPGLKKPMDFVEEHENKLSALLASPIVLAEAKHLIDRSGLLAGWGEGLGTPLVTAGLAAAGGADGWSRPIVEIGLGVFTLACYAVVFLAFHAVQVLIALSPSATLDMLLRLFRLSFLGWLALAAAIHPYLGAGLGFAILVVAWWIAGWSFRWTVYGTVVSWDILLGRDGSIDPRSAPLVAFSARALAGVPARTYGRLEPGAASDWRFRYRPWLVLPARTALVGQPAELVLRRGALSPTLFRRGVVREPTLIRFPPRFRLAEDGLATRLGVLEVRDGRIVRGLKAAWSWLRATLAGADPAETPAGG